MVSFFQQFLQRIERLHYQSSYSIKTKLIAIFVVIKILPIVFLSWIAWFQIVNLSTGLETQSSEIIQSTRGKVSEIGRIAADDSVKALDVRARESIEQLTTATAQSVAAFLYDRDSDIRLAAELPPTEAAFRTFLAHRTRPVFEHDRWILSEDGNSWIPVQKQESNDSPILPRVKDNETDWNYRKPERLGKVVNRPLFLEMTYIGIDGTERVKVVTAEFMNHELRNVSQRENTYVKAETYWERLKALKPGEIYVSEVVGPYVGSPIIGPYTPSRAKELGIEFAPEKAAYAGKENPVGKKFQGLVRWAMPVEADGQIVGFITLALDHRHLMEFTDHIVPTDERVSSIKDAASGNYAFIWDYKGRSICHPREHSIAGYDPDTGEPAVPWLEDALYRQWQASGKTLSQFLSSTPEFLDPSNKKKPASELTKAGQVGLDCRYLNFAPQCSGWHELTEQGGSGSFLILWSGLWKRTTAASIPYYTGIYGAHPRGFGYVTVGANIEEFQRPAKVSAVHIFNLVESFAGEIDARQKAATATIAGAMRSTFWNLTWTTLLMIAVVVVIAVWMANMITRQLTRMIAGIRTFESGDFNTRLKIASRDELGALAVEFNNMADSLQTNIAELERQKVKAEEANRLKSEFLAHVSHELRTPLNGIQGFAEVLEHELADDPERAEYAATIRSSAQHLYKLLNNILDVAKIEAGRMGYEQVELDPMDVVNEVVALHQSTAREKGLILSVDAASAPQSVICDPTRFRQTLNNLLSNALKFTEHGSIAVTVRQSDHMAEFAVTDTGPGIPAELHEAIFDRFRQGNAFVTRSHEGSGLGLALVKELVAGMGGTVRLVSEPGSGACFVFSLPLGPNKGQEGAYV